jgi:hypothetical protein
MHRIPFRTLKIKCVKPLSTLDVVENPDPIKIFTAPKKNLGSLHPSGQSIRIKQVNKIQIQNLF